MLCVKDIRSLFMDELTNQNFVTDKTGVKTIELMGQSFIADEFAIIGSPSKEYIAREIEWYTSKSLYVDDIANGAPTIWKQVASKHGRINSNYGWCIFSEENKSQYSYCLDTLLNDSDSRRAVMIYMRPSMQVDYNTDGMSDFMCTWGVQYLIRDNKLNAVVNMRSNDAVYGYKNDVAWAYHVLYSMINDYNKCLKSNLECGNVIWNAGSLHIYERHFDLLKREFK